MPGASSQSAAANRPTASSGGLKSMTGYAQTQATENGWSLRVSVRSVNHRFLDLHVRLPEGFEPLEPLLRQAVRERLRRGHVEVALQYEVAGPASVGINQDVAAAYLQAANSLRERFGVRTEPDLAAIFRLPGVVGPPAGSLEEEFARLEAVVTRCLGQALDRLDDMRKREGTALREEMSRHLGAITRLAEEVAGLVETARPAFARRLESRLKELLGQAQLDPARLAQEAALAAERSDVSEELARLASHARQFESLLGGASEGGKKMDFLLQEMQREANTLLAKSPGNGAEGLEITQLALEIKSEIEKLREQAQNIE